MKEYRIEQWGERGYYSVSEIVPGEHRYNDILIAVCVYKKGAAEIKRRLDELEAEIEKLKEGL